MSGPGSGKMVLAVSKSNPGICSRPPGFAHEQNRDDTPSSCTEPKQGSYGDETFGDWDPNSIMNYCNLVWNNGGNLSSTDIAGAQFYYGMGPRYVAAMMATIALI